MTDECKKARHYALWLLSKQAYPSAQLKRKILQKGYSDSECDFAIQECTRLGYLDDDEWMKLYINGQIRKCVGPLRLIQKMTTKGIDYQTAKGATEEHYSWEQQQLAAEAALKKANKSEEELDYKERQKLFQSLVRKGFSYEIIQNAFSQQS